MTDTTRAAGPTGWTERRFPDAHVVALVGAVVVALVALADGTSPTGIAQVFGGGFGHLTAMDLGWTVLIHHVTEALPGLVDPFSMLPLLAGLGLRACDLVGSTVVQLLLHLPVVLFLLWLRGTSFDVEPPVIP